MRTKFKGIYLITIESSETVYRYVGQSKNIMKRKENHILSLRHNRHKNPFLQNVFNKYGESTYKFQVLEKLPDTVTAEELTEKEESYCQLFQTYEWDSKSGCNLRLPSNSLKFSPAIREKLSVTHKAKWENPEYRERMLKLQHTEESRKKLSESAKKQWQDPEFRKLVVKKLQENGNLKHASRAVITTDSEGNIIEYPSMKALAKAFNCGKKAVTNALHGKVNFSYTFKDLKVSFKDEGFAKAQRGDAAYEKSKQIVEKLEKLVEP